MRSEVMIKDYRDCRLEWGLEDMGFMGDPFTWRRVVIQERLDHAFRNGYWALKFPQALVVHKPHV